MKTVFGDDSLFIGVGGVCVTIHKSEIIKFRGEVERIIKFAEAVLQDEDIRNDREENTGTQGTTEN